MKQTTAVLKTEQASRYLTQLCRHFAHKVDVSWEGGHGECRFVCGNATLDASAGELRIGASAPDEAQLHETQSVVERHLVRFAFRENIEPLIWQPLQEATAGS